MSAFPFLVSWVDGDGQNWTSSFANKNEAIQAALALMDEPGVARVSTVYTDHVGRGSYIPEGCQ